jgi:hypothetical protein
MIVDHPTLSGTPIDVRGGYHDASDHLRYTATTANSVYQMMFAYMMSPEILATIMMLPELPGSNGIPDILDEVKWGLEWLLKMNPDSGMMYNQVADDRDHQGFPAARTLILQVTAWALQACLFRDRQASGAGRVQEPHRGGCLHGR